MPSRIADIPVPPRYREMIRAGALVAINTSGGKDSQAMTILLSRIIPRDQLVAVHAPLGEVEWPGTVEHIEATLPAGVPLIFAPVASGRMLRFVRDALSRAGYAPLVTGEAHELDTIIRAERPRLVLLDLILPGTDGMALMQEIRERFDLLVVFISAYGRDETVARALESGAADYLVKPFSPTELVARVRAALGRHERPEPFMLGDLAIDYARRRVTVGGDPVDLTATEYELLRVLSLDAGRVVSFETLLDRAWKGREDASENRVRICVRNLRRKLGDDAANPDYIFSERGVGYRMPEPGER